MKEKFIEPKAEIVVFESVDTIRTSLIIDGTEE